MSDKVKCRKMTTAAFNALANKRADTLYFVNATGDFDPQSMNETDGDIYLGDKLLTEKPSPPAFPAYLPGARVSIDALDPFGEYTPLESAYNANQQTRIDTGVTTYNDDVEFHIRFRQTQAGIYMRLFGADTGGSLRYRIGFIALSTTDITLCCRSTTGALTSTITRAKDHVYTLVGKLLNGSITLFVRDETTGETDLQTGTYDVDTGYAPPIRLFYISNQNAYQASGTHVYQAMLKVKGRTVLNYVPATRKADGEIGFINTVAGSFVSAANGTWLAGNPAAASAYVVTADPPDIHRFTYGSDTTPPVPGLDGLVPSPTYGERNKFLRGDGTWQALPVPSVMSGATAQADGVSGLVPQPLAGDNENFLSGDGTFRYPAAMFGRCATAAGTKAKTVTVSGPFQLVDGAVVFVRFANSNSIASPTLEVNGTGPKPIARYGTTAPSTSTGLSWNAGSIQCLVYDGTNERWVLLGWINTTYGDFTGASSSGDGAHGLVPKPLLGQHKYVLCGNGIWQNVYGLLEAGDNVTIDPINGISSDNNVDRGGIGPSSNYWGISCVQNHTTHRQIYFSNINRVGVYMIVCHLTFQDVGRADGLNMINVGLFAGYALRSRSEIEDVPPILVQKLPIQSGTGASTTLTATFTITNSMMADGFNLYLGFGFESKFPVSLVGFYNDTTIRMTDLRVFRVGGLGGEKEITQPDGIEDGTFNVT